MKRGTKLIGLSPAKLDELRATVAKSAAAALQLTDWIPCTTPPVREGEYEVESVVYGQKPWRATYRDGKWCTAEDGHFNPAGTLMGDTMQYPDRYRWRGVRRWVLVRPSSLDKSKLAYLQKIPTRGRRVGIPHFHYDLEQAMGFDTKAQAEAFRDSCWPFGWGDDVTAVLP